ncbi:MAG: alpha-amylase family glycosyl hydrolase, partial [Verrucomicrobiae bacterium]|nr:alpha-amylase family glycosyl hydrolase [Verrucomicrobiae bacterium]
MTARWRRALQTALVLTTGWLACSSSEAASNVFLAGSFNEWNPTNTAWQLQPLTNQIWALEQFFARDRHELKFVVDGQWRGMGAGGRLVTGGENIRWEVTRSGVYRIELDLREQQWRAQQARAHRPYAVLRMRGTPAVNRPVWLDASESISRSGRTNLTYRFWQDEGDAARVELPARPVDTPRVRITLPRDGNYRFWLAVDDGEPSEPVSLTVRAQRTYQVVGDWTASDPLNPVTFLQPVEPGIYERWLRSDQPGEYQLLLIRNHDPAVVLHFLTVSVTQTNAQYWRVRYEEDVDSFRCDPVAATEFVFDPADFPLLEDHGVVIESVHLAGTFNDWSITRHAMERQSDGTYRIALPLDEGLHHYKFVVNGSIWLTDHRADPTLGADDGHGGRNSGVYVGRRGNEYGELRPNHILMEAVRVQVNRVSAELIEVTARTVARDVERVEVQLGNATRALRRSGTAFGFDHWRDETFVGTNVTGIAVRLVDGSAREELGPVEVPAVPVFATPEWAKHVVWYQIFPDRFANGTRENDPPRALPWKWDWYQFAAWEQPNEDRTFSPDWYNRWFGGDFQGIIQRLGYLRDLGVTALYLCPVFEARSYHGYDTTDYRHIMRWFGFRESFPVETLDPSTWQWTKSDRLFLEFLQRARAAGMKVIVDGVFNHMGRDSFALQDVLTNGAQSIYADWFDVTDWGPPVRYNSWDGGGWMPNFRKNQRHGIASPSAREYLLNITRRWMDPNGDGDPSDGVDGWRLDVAADIPAAFWRDWRKFVKSINPNAYIVGEHWGEPVDHLRGDQWDATMNYAFAVRAIRFFIDRDRKITASEFDRQLRELREKYPLQVNLVMQNLFDSH